MKQTAVEKLIEQLTPILDRSKISDTMLHNLVEEHLKIEKQQIMDAYDEGKSDGYKTAREWDEMIIFSNSEQYYNQKYKQD